MSEYWCVSCERNVTPNFHESKRGGWLLLLILIGLVLLPFGLLPGIIVLSAAGIYFFYGLFTELADRKKPACPICNGVRFHEAKQKDS